MRGCSCVTAAAFAEVAAAMNTGAPTATVRAATPAAIEVLNRVVMKLSSNLSAPFDGTLMATPWLRCEKTMAGAGRSKIMEH
jgi:hypothetical protein